MTAEHEIACWRKIELAVTDGKKIEKSQSYKLENELRRPLSGRMFFSSLKSGG